MWPLDKSSVMLIAHSLAVAVAIEAPAAAAGWECNASKLKKVPMPATIGATTALERIKADVSQSSSLHKSLMSLKTRNL